MTLGRGPESSLTLRGGTVGDVASRPRSRLRRQLVAANLIALLVLVELTLDPIGQVVWAVDPNWTRYENADTWSGRDGAGLLVLRDELYLLGGWVNGDVSNEVWKTSDLVHWEFLGHAPWAARHGAAWLVHDDQLWVIGGDLHPDVWSSPDGKQWVEHTSNAPFGSRYTPNAVSKDGRIILFAGQAWTPDPWCCTPVADSDVWESVDGATWTKIATAPWPPRALIHGSAVFENTIFLIGGGLKAAPEPGQPAQTTAELTDVWSSSDGSTWELRTPRFSFPARTHATVAASPDGCYVFGGSVGTQEHRTHDLYFAANCVDFSPVRTPWGMRDRHAGSAAWFNGGLVLLGGPQPVRSAVWDYRP
jgi:hypothetical protein